MFHFIFEQIYINERENGEYQCRKSRLFVKNNKRYASGQRVIFHGAQKKQRGNFISGGMKESACFYDNQRS
jgi:hypothetical protein